MQQIQKLPQEIINQIAAGEVIERPASVIKELVDNCIDAKATEIRVRLKSGGMRLIEVFDNGSGISKDDLKTAFEPHATSKITNFEDLNSLMTMGFRGEALSTIQSISEVSAISKTSDSPNAYKITYNKVNKGDVTAAAHNQGTTISVENIFYNVPARQKFLKSEETEYRKILEVMTSFFLIHPEIHFTLEKDGKQVFNLPSISGAAPTTIHPARVKEVIKSDFTAEMLNFYYDGDGIRIGGLIAHPKYHAQKTSHIYVFVNSRPVNDHGVVRAVLQGLARFIPHGEKVPFIINVQLNPSQVDVNVHPRKEEVRFINPYRIYTAIEQSVTSALQKEVKAENTMTGNYSSSTSESEVGYSRLRDNTPGFMSDSVSGDTAFNPREISFNKRKEFDVNRSIEFSKTMLEFDASETRDSANTTGELFGSGSSEEMPPIQAQNYYQVFNKYIIAEYADQIWLIDQHAAAERVNFERLTKSLKSETKNSQRLLVASEINLTPQELSYLAENKSFFEDLGFEIEIKDDEVEIKAVPTEVIGSNYDEVFKSLFELEQDSLDLKNNFEKAKEDMIATIACHTSIRKGQKLNPVEMRALHENLMKCDTPYSCPHGRPAIWKLRIEEIDKHFLRTY